MAFLPVILVPSGYFLLFLLFLQVFLVDFVIARDVRIRILVGCLRFLILLCHNVLLLNGRRMNHISVYSPNAIITRLEQADRALAHVVTALCALAHGEAGSMRA